MTVRLLKALKVTGRAWMTLVPLNGGMRPVWSPTGKLALLTTRLPLGVFRVIDGAVLNTRSSKPLVTLKLPTVTVVSLAVAARLIWLPLVSEPV